MILPDSRGQAYITEALLAIILLAGVVIVAPGTLAIDEPLLTAADREKQSDVANELDRLLTNSVEDGTLKASILNWNDDNRRYADTQTLQDADGFYLALPSDRFGSRLDAFRQQHDNVSVSVEVAPIVPDQNSQSTALDDSRHPGYPFISTGSAGQTMVVSETYVTLYTTDRLQSPPQAHRLSPSSEQTTQGTVELKNSNTFPVESAATTTSGDEVYNIVRVRVVAWF